MKKFVCIISLMLIMTMCIGNVAYAAPEMDTYESEITDPHYAILDGIRYGLSFNGNTASCYAMMMSEHATKYVVRSTLQKKNSNGYYDYVYSWPEETFYGQSCDYVKSCLTAGYGEYCFTIYVTIYNGNETEPLVFTYHKTRE